MTDAEFAMHIADLTEQEISFANRELCSDIAHAALDFWRRLGADVPIDVALMILRDEIREGFATRKAKPPYVASQASLIQ